MASSYIPLYKTIVLYMLRRAETTLTRAQIMDFVLGAGYTNYMTLQETFGELLRQELVAEETAGRRTYLHLTQTGADTLDAIRNQIRPDIVQQIDDYLSEKRLELRDESSLRADYRRLASGAYEVSLEAFENGRRLYAVTIEAPTEETAEKVCENWRNNCSEIYHILSKKLIY